jgi:hypothetical protein
VVGLGVTFGFGLIQATAERAFPRSLPFALTVLGKMDRGMVLPLALVVGATGIYQSIDGPYEFGRDQWLDIGATIWLVLVLVSLLIFRRGTPKAIAEAERMVAAAGPDGEVQLSDEYRRITRPMNIFGAVAGLLTVIVLYLMVVKPFTG